MTTAESTKPLPSKWAADSLSDHIDAAFGNSLATFVHKKPQYSILLTVDNCFLEITQNLSVTGELLEPLFLIRSHSAFRAGCQLAMSGQCTESFCVFRSCLEFALYGLSIAKNKSLGEIWLHRHRDDESNKQVRREFSYRAVISVLKDVDPELCKTVNMLYERTIDFGGHPNERSITSNITMNMDDGDALIKQYYLLGDTLALDHGLKSAAQIGLSSLYIFRHIFREKFDILDVTTTLDQLRGHL